MKIEAKLESIAGAWSPVLFFPDDVDRNKSIGAYSDCDGHVSASRAYMRQCRKPESPADFAAVFDCLARYFRQAKQYAETR